MNSAAKRLSYSIFIGIVLTFFAGYIGLLMLPIHLGFWLLLVIQPIFDGQRLPLAFESALVGAHFAWPVTCIIFPLTAAWRPVTLRTHWLFLVLGAIAGGLTMPLTTYLTTRGPSLIHDQNRVVGFYAAGVVAGAFCGYIFGHLMWRYDEKHAVSTAA